MGWFRKMYGFTFVETILAIVMVGAVASVAAMVLTSGLDIYSLLVNRHDASQNARLAMERIVDELVMIDSPYILGMTNTRISFTDAEGHSTNFKSYTVSRNGRSVPCIYRDDDYLAGDVTFLDFDYYKDDGSATIYAWQVRRINIDFIVGTPAGTGAGQVHLRTDVFPRKFMYSNFE